jgi:serine protease Do
MTTRRLHPFLLALAVGLGAGCQHQEARATPQVPGAAPSGAGATAGGPAPFATPPVLPGTPDIASLVARINPAVVNITTVHQVKAAEMEMPFGLDPFGMFPFGGRGPRGDQVFRQKALGTGFLVDSAGHVVTNAHVVEGADDVKVKLADDREFEAKVRGRDTRLDLAVLELVGAKGLPAASLGSSQELRVGEYVVAIGNPFGLGHTVTMGIVSAKSRAIGAGPYDDFIQTDASINPGNSGGPLFNLRGQVIGINTAIKANGQGIGFAIPIDALKDVLPQLLTTGHVARGRLGVVIQQVDAPMAKALGLDKPRGALVGDVEPGGPAERAGIKAGDLITKIDDTVIGRSEELPRVVARHAPGSRVKVELERERSTRTIDVALDSLKDADDPSQRGGAPGGPSGGSSAHAPNLGVSLGDSSEGVVVERVLPGSVAGGELAPGDVILEVNRRPVARALDAIRQIGAIPAGAPLLLKVKREGRTRFVAIER